jgi:hypothetical protein
LRQLSRERTVKKEVGLSERKGGKTTGERTVKMEADLSEWKVTKTAGEKREAGEMVVCSWVAWVKLFYSGLDPLRHLEDWGANTRRSRRLAGYPAVH